MEIDINFFVTSFHIQNYRSIWIFRADGNVWCYLNLFLKKMTKEILIYNFIWLLDWILLFY